MIVCPRLGEFEGRIMQQRADKSATKVGNIEDYANGATKRTSDTNQTEKHARRTFRRSQNEALLKIFTFINATSTTNAFIPLFETLR
jgi:hypothetical protein